MKKLLSILLVPLFVFTFSGTVFGWGSTGGDGSDYRQLQETAVFYNNTAAGAHSDYSVYHGQAVILDTDGSDVSSGTTMGAYIEKPASGSGNADSVLVVGVAAGSGGPWLVSRPIVVVTKGPALVQVEDLSDAIAAGDSVGCGDILGEGSIGEGTNLGIALEAGDGTDGDEIIIWVSPTGGQ